MKRSAYFAYADAVRGEVREGLLAIQNSAADGTCDAAQPKISVASVAKEIGARWKALSDEERQIWKEKAAEENAAAALNGEEDNADAVDGDEADKEQAGPSLSEGLLPLSLVKKIACSEPDSNIRISAEGLIAIAKATDLLLGLLVQGSVKVAQSQKRRTVQLKDYVNALKVDKRLSGIGLRDIEQLVKARSEAEASAKAAKLAEMQDRPVSEEGERDSSKEVENLDPNKVERAPEADGKSTKRVVDSKKGRRPANPEEKKAKRAKAEEVASKGTRKIDCFFSKAPKKVEEQYEEEIGEVD